MLSLSFFVPYTLHPHSTVNIGHASQPNYCLDRVYHTRLRFTLARHSKCTQRWSISQTRSTARRRGGYGGLPLIPRFQSLKFLGAPIHRSLCPRLPGLDVLANQIRQLRITLISCATTHIITGSGGSRTKPQEYEIQRGGEACGEIHAPTAGYPDGGAEPCGSGGGDALDEVVTFSRDWIHLARLYNESGSQETDSRWNGCRYSRRVPRLLSCFIALKLISTPSRRKVSVSRWYVSQGFVSPRISLTIGPDKNPNVEFIVNSALPRLTSAIVLIPAGLSLDRRSYPIRLPRKTAMSRFLPRKHSVFVKNNNAG